MNYTIQRMNYIIHSMILKSPRRCLTGGYGTEGVEETAVTILPQRTSDILICPPNA